MKKNKMPRGFQNDNDQRKNKYENLEKTSMPPRIQSGLLPVSFDKYLKTTRNRSGVSQLVGTNSKNLYSDISSEMSNQSTKMTAHSSKSKNPIRTGERYNLRNRAADSLETQSYVGRPTSRKSLRTLPLSHSESPDDSLMQYDYGTTDIKEYSSYSRNRTDSSSVSSFRRSRSAGPYSRDPSPKYKQRKENTSPITVESYDDSLDNFNSLMRNSQKPFSNSREDLTYSYSSEAKLRKEKDLVSKHLSKTPYTASFMDSQYFDSDVSLEIPQSNKVQHQKTHVKQESIRLSMDWVDLLSKYYDDFLKILKSKLKENIDLRVNQNIATLRCINIDLVKSLLKNDLTIIDHDSGQQSWLKAKFEEWENLIASLQNQFFCAIFTEEDFSKTYICTKVTECELVFSKISEFFDQSPIDVKISPHVMEFISCNKKFSNIKLEVTAKGRIWIRNIKKPLLMALEEEIRNITYQSYLLNDNQFELLHEIKKEVLVNIRKNFQVKGTLYELPVVGDVPVVCQVNPLTIVSCFVLSVPENMPVDSHIKVNLLTPHSTSDIPVGIYEHFNWKSDHRQCLQIQVTELSTSDEDWTQYFFECLTKIFSEDIPPVTIGISFPPMSFRLKNICLCLLGALQILWQRSSIPIKCYVILIVPEEKMKSLVENILNSLTSPDKGLSKSMSPRDSIVVKVVQGNLADQQVDVIVNSTNTALDLKYGKISSSLLKKAGSALQKECIRKYPKGITYEDFALTKGYKLPCKYVIHGAIPSNSKDTVIKDFVFKCLTFTIKNSLSSIAFPALGTGTLNYPVPQVVQQFHDAFRKLEHHQLKRPLPEVRIVLYSEDMDLKLFHKLDNSQKGISTTDIIQVQSNETPAQSMKWIQFVNYTCSAENLALAISALEEDLKQPQVSAVKIPVEEFQDVFFFKDLRSVIPDIVQQLDNKKEKFYHLHLSPETQEELKTLMLEVKESVKQEQLNITQPLSSVVLEHCLLKTKQVYPQVKFTVINGNRSVIIESLDWNLTQAAKYYLEVWLGMKVALAVSKDRFKQVKDSTTIHGRTSFSPSAAVTQATRFSRNYQEDTQPAASSALSAPFAKSVISVKNSPNDQVLSKGGITIQNSPNNICCVQTENGLIIKIYQGDLLNVDVDGIVNAANKWLNHGGGVARAIIKAAGDVVNREGQQKLNGKLLGDGEVLSTSAGNLHRYKNIIHAVGPVYTASKNNDYCLEKIAMAIYKSLEEAKNLNLRSIALPALSSAIFGVPMEICTQGYYTGVRIFSEKYPNSCLKEVHFVDKNEFSVKEIQKLFNSYFISINEESTSNTQSSKNLNPQPSSAYKADSSSMTSNCLICLSKMKNPTILNKCKHVFCANCIEQSMKYKPRCPQCKMSYGIETGDQPPGTMKYTKIKFTLPGSEVNTTFCIKYEIENPLTKRLSTREAYLPATKEGTIVLKMLQLAFERRLIFTVGESRTTGAQNVVTWNDIHHKTNISGGSLQFGYPDATYLERVTQELASHGITADDVANRELQNIVKAP